MSVLVATDIAARGIDVHDVSLVVHVDPPAEHKAYLHRAGRTARAGEAGTVVTLVMNPQRDEVDKLITKAGVEAERIDMSTDNSPAYNRKLALITGAQAPTGIALPEPGQQQKKQPAKSQKSNSRGGGGRNSSARGGSSRGGSSRGDSSRGDSSRGNSSRGKGGQGNRGASASNKPSRTSNSRRRSR